MADVLEFKKPVRDRIIYLVESDHDHCFVRIMHTGKERLLPHGTDAFRIPAGSEVIKVTCEDHGVVLMENEDYELRELQPWERQ